MYSVVLMAAMTANTAEAPAFFKHRPLGCYGGLFAHSGLYASCMGYWGGGWGACYGCSGGWGACYGCYGGSWAASYGGCYGCMGCYGAWHGYGSYMVPGPIAYPGMNPMTLPPVTGGETGPAPGTTPPPAGTIPPTVDTSAKLIIEKPADAQLFVDDRPVTSEGIRNAFATPNLNPAQAYYYMVRVEMVREGKPVSETRRVIVRAGETVQESFREPAITTVSLPGLTNR